MNNYISLVQALIREEDLVSVVEALQELYATTPQAELQANQQLLSHIKELLSNFLQQRRKNEDKLHKLDQFYYYLVDHSSKSTHPVPIILLDAVIETCGKMGMMDRAFATLEEYQSYFKVKPTIESYNSMLHACLHSPTNTLQQMLSIFQDLESKSKTDPALSPNALSFQYLIKAVHGVKEYNILDQIVQHMLDKKIVPTERTLRLLTWHYAKQNNKKQVQLCQEMLEKVTKSEKVPFYVTHRVKSLLESASSTTPSS